MSEVESVRMREAIRRVFRKLKITRPVAFASLAGLLTLCLGTAEAGNVQFSSTTPAVVDVNPASNAQPSSQRPEIRRGREPSEGLSRSLRVPTGQEFAPQPNAIRARMAPVAATEAIEHDKRVAREMPAGINANGTIETMAKLDRKRGRKAARDDVPLQNFAQPSRMTRGVGVTADNGIVTNSPPPGPASLEELARALRYHPDLIYQFVRNNIEIDPVRGIHKGALGAVLDNHGSAADQSQLMVSLLRLSGYDARIVRGVIKLSAQQFADWYGVQTHNVCAVLNLMGQTQIPIYDVNATQAGSCPGLNASLTGISIEHFWVKTNIDGTWYTFDPSYKPHVVKTGIDLNAAAGYSTTTLLQNARAGATVTPDLVRGLKRTGIHDYLGRAANNLADWIGKNKPTATLSDIVGGKSIVPFYSGALRQTQNALLDTRWASQEWGDIPVGYKPTVRVQYQGIDQTFTADAIYGKRLTITYNASNQPVLRLDGQTMGAPGTAVAPGADSVVTFMVWHNAYPNDQADHAFEQHIKGGGKYLIVNGWGPTGRGLSQHYLKNLEGLRAAGHADDSEAVLGASLGVMGAQWVSQTTRSASITDRLANAFTVQHHQVGIAGYTDGPYVDLPSNMSSPVQMDGNTVLERAVFDSLGMHSSILESTAVNQTSGVSAVSTVKLLDLAMMRGQTIYSAKSGNYAGVVRPALKNCQAHLGNFQYYVSRGFQLLLPGNCQLVENRWNGVGYFVRGMGNTRLLGAIINGGYSGGFFTSPVPAPTYNISTLNSSKSPINLTGYFGPQAVAGDPVDMVHGNFLFEHQDLKTGYGDSSDSLNFQRFYSSGMKNQAGVLGKGWTHNYDINIRTASDGFLGMGDRLALDAVGAIVEHKVSLDLLNDPDVPADRFLTAVIAQRWFGDQLVDNTKIVRMGLNSDVFVKLPRFDCCTSGGYSSPPGKAVRFEDLTVSGTARYVLMRKGTDEGASFTFDMKTGKALRYVEQSGKAIDFTWAGDLLARVENSAGRSLTLAYSNGLLQSVSSPQKTVRYAYDGNANLIGVTDPEGFATRFEYDKPGRMTKFYEPSFPGTPVVTNVYDTLDRVRTQTSAAGNVFNYYFAGSRTEEVGPGGSARTNYIDGEGNLLQSGDPTGNWTVKAYDGQNRLVRETRPEGNRIEYVYYDLTCGNASHLCSHQPAAITQYPRPGSGDPVLTQKFVYSGDRLASVTDSRGNVTAYSYHHSGLLDRITKPAVAGVSPVTTFTYEFVTPPGKDPFFRQTRMTESIRAGSTTSTAISYAADHTPSVVTQDDTGQRIKTAMTFDNEGRLVSSQRDGAPKITYTYDKRDNVTRTNASLLGADEVIAYDANNRENRRGVAIVGGAMVTCKRYNAMGDVVRVWGPAKTANVTTCPVEASPTPITDTAYDDHHRPSRVMRYQSAADGGNRVTDTEYYADDRVKSVRKAVSTGLAQTYVSYTYNPNGTVATTTDAKGNTTVSLYDGHDRLYRTHYPLEGRPGMGNANDFEQYTWDANGNLVAQRKRDGQTVAQTFDELNRVSARTFPGGVGNVRYSYDLRGLKTASRFSDGSHTITNSYDGLGQLTQTSVAGRTLSYRYDAAGNVTDVAWPDGFHVGIAYDGYGRPSQLLENGTTSLAKYSYDALNRRTRVDLGNGTRTEYAYDNQGWLSTQNHRFTSSAEDWLSNFTRNQLGEIKRSSVTNNRYGWVPAAMSNMYTTNALNQYTGVAGKAVRYDRNGNLTGDGAWTYTYDLDNRMKTAVRAGTSAALMYDPEGRLVKTSINGVDTVLLYDGQNLAAEYDGAGKLVRRYVFGPGIDEPLVQYEGAGTAAKNWLYANQQGSVVALANGSGATTSSQAYGPFGETNGAPASRFGYTGQQYLAPLGLYYYKARMYSPALGRFLQTDPIGYKDDLNWYAYVGNNPVNLTDPSGLAAASAKAFNNSTLGSATAFEFRSAGFSSGPSYQTAAAPFVALFVFGSIANSIANDDVPLGVGGAFKAVAKGGAVAAKSVTETIRVGELVATHGKTMSNKQLDKLVKNIRTEGVKEPLTVTEYQGKLHILDGHHRALAAPRAGVAEVPINRVELPWGPYKTPADLTFTPRGY